MNGDHLYMDRLDETTALNRALSDRNEDMIKLLLAKGANVNEEDGTPKLLFDAVSYGGSKDIIKLMLEKGANVNAEYVGDTVLEKAIDSGRVDVVELLLDKGANVNLKRKYATVLMRAIRAKKGRADIVKLLLARGADVNAQGPYGSTAVMLAIELGDKDSLELLLAHGADVNEKGGAFGRTPLMLTVDGGKGYREGCLKLLLDKGADVNAMDARGKTALMYAIEGGNKEMVGLLVASAVDGRTALMLAAESGDGGIVSRLLAAKGGNIKERDVLNSIFMRSGSAEVMKLLLANGADIDLKSDIGKSLLERWIREPVIPEPPEPGPESGNGYMEDGQWHHYWPTPKEVIQNRNRIEIIYFLMTNGADFDPKTPAVREIYYNADRSRREDIVNLLKAKGVT